MSATYTPFPVLATVSRDEVHEELVRLKRALPRAAKAAKAARETTALAKRIVDALVKANEKRRKILSGGSRVVTRQLQRWGHLGEVDLEHVRRAWTLVRRSTTFVFGEGDRFEVEFEGWYGR